MNLIIEDREIYFNNNLHRWIDVLVFSPRLLDKWEKGIQQSLMVHLNFDILYRQMEFEE